MDTAVQHYSMGMRTKAVENKTSFGLILVDQYQSPGWNWYPTIYEYCKFLHPTWRFFIHKVSTAWYIWCSWGDAGDTLRWERSLPRSLYSRYCKTTLYQTKSRTKMPNIGTVEHFLRNSQENANTFSNNSRSY